MNCLDFLDRLADLAAGLASPAEQDEAERHAAGCQECAELLRAARSDSSAFAVPGEDARPDDLVDAVLARTAGAACGRAEDLLCDYVDGELPREERALVAEHLAYCARCAALADALQQATAALPLLAEMEPGAEFALRVLHATSRGPLAVRRRAAPSAWAARVAGWWERALARPRFAFEVAYVATLVLLLVAGNPASTLQAASAHTAMASARLERATAGWSSALSEFVASSPAWQVAGRAADIVRGVHDGPAAPPGILSRVAERCASAWAWLRGLASSAVETVANSWARVRSLGAQWFGRASEPRQDAARSRG